MKMETTVLFLGVLFAIILATRFYVQNKNETIGVISNKDALEKQLLMDLSPIALLDAFIKSELISMVKNDVKKMEAKYLTPAIERQWQEELGNRIQERMSDTMFKKLLLVFSKEGITKEISERCYIAIIDYGIDLQKQIEQEDILKGIKK